MGARAPAGRRRRVSFAWLGLVPFFAYVSVFLLWPTLAVFWKAAHNKAGDFSLSTYGQILSTEQLRKSFWNSTLLSIDSAVLGAVIGSLLAYALVTLTRPRWLRNAVTAFSAVAANMGGLPLVFFFVAAIGVKGMLTTFLIEHNVELYDAHFIYNNPLRSLTVIYLYFQIPLMVIVMLPAIDGLKASWREAATNLGATNFQYWRRVGMPVLWPAFLGGLVLLFANSFAAYATAYVLSGGQTNLASIQIGFFLQGNTIADSQQIGYAIAAWMIVVVFVAIILYQWLRSRTGEVATMSTIHPGITVAPPTKATRRKRPTNLGMWLVVGMCAVYFLFPIWAVLKFTLYLPKQGWTLKAYIDTLKEPGVRSTFWLSVQIAFWTIMLSLVLMLWTVLWTTLKVRRVQPVVEFISILPYMVPPIAFVVGIAGVFRPAFPSFIANPWCLVFFYTVLAMPFTYRTLDAGLRAIDVKTLTEASRGLGAGWLATIWRVVIPNIRAALLGATFLTVAVVLGEYTIASLLLITTFSVQVAVVNQQEIFGGPALGLLSMLVVALMFGALGLFTRKRGGTNAATTTIV